MAGIDWENIKDFEKIANDQGFFIPYPATGIR